VEKVIELITTLKIPTLAFLGIIFLTAFFLIKDSDLYSLSGMAGALLLCVGCVLGIIFFIDYRYKEQSEHMIEQQGKVITNLSKTLKNTSDTHIKFEKQTQATISSAGKTGKYYIENNSETLTK
jgi:hypothetical protein